MKQLTKRICSLLLCLAMLLSMAPALNLTVSAASIGDRKDETLDYTISGTDYISLPIEINDFENDGMLFEFASPAGLSSGSYYYEVPTVNIGWDFTKSSSLSQIKGLQSTTGHNNRKMNNTFTLSQGVWASGSEDSVSFNALCAYRSSTSGSGWSAGNATSGTNVENELLTLGNLGGIQKNKARYMAFGYLAPYDSHRNSDGLFAFARTSATSAPIPLTSQKTLTYDNTWRNAILDLGENTENWNSLTTLNYISINPIKASSSGVSPRFYISYVAFFSTQAEAQAFINKVNAVRGTYKISSNHGFGLVGASKDAGNVTRVKSAYATSDTDDIKWVGQSSSMGLSLPLSLNTQSSYLQSTLTSGQCVIGLMNPTLNSKGLPTYSDDTVSYIANHLKESLEIPRRDSTTGYYNYNYVSGASSSIFGGTDLATALRTQLAKNSNTLGTLSSTKAKAAKLIGSFSTCKANITTYYDAAYYLLNNLFVQGSYSTVDTNFTHLRLAKTTIDGQECYVFDGGLADNSGKNTTVYNKNTHVIYNSTNSTKKAYSYYYTGATDLTTTYPFLPMVDKNNAAGQTYIPYFRDDGARNAAGVFNTYAERDYNFTLKGSGQFVYQESDNLFFEFEGDDDVYMYINGQLVLDCGGAHPIATQRVNLNDYVSAAKKKVAAGDTSAYYTGLALEDGETYTFDFFYMERKGYGANLRITTNIKITDTSISGEKDAIQENIVLPTGSNIDFDLPVEFAFHLTNNGTDSINQTGNPNIADNALLNVSFVDSKLGVTIDSTKGLQVNGTNIVNTSGKTLTASDLTLILKNASGKIIATHKPKNNAALISYLKTPNGTGIEAGCTLTVRGICKKMTVSDFGTNRTYINTVDITCTSDAGQELHTQGVAKLRNVAALNYYTWAGHDVLVSKAELVSDLSENIKSGAMSDLFVDGSGKSIDITKATIKKLEFVNSVGVPVSSTYASITSALGLKLNYPVGTSKEFLRVSYTYSGKAYTAIVPFAVYTVTVKDQVLVLDYALPSYLAKNGILEEDDQLAVAGRTTKWKTENIALKAPTYGSNHITLNGAVGGNAIFDYSSGQIKYTPPANTMSDPQPLSAYVLYRVYESGKTPSAVGTTNINYEVEMYKKVTVIPASVVYYEDDFPAITYYDEDGDKINDNGNTVKVDGSGSWSTTFQSNNQDSPYGYDDYYANSTLVTNTGGHFTRIDITHPSAIDSPDASFTFSGTGFELIGITNATTSATVILRVMDSKGTQVALVPVITEYDNGANGGSDSIYAAPIARINDLPYGKYTVDIIGVAAYAYDENGQRIPDGNGDYKINSTTIFIDGIRIYDPLGGGTYAGYTQYYNDSERGAKIVELRDLLASQQAAIVTTATNGVTIYNGNYSYVENRIGVGNLGLEFTGNVADSIENYVLLGPNNELYLSGSSEKTQAIAFYVAENGSGTHSLQVALRLLHDGRFNGANDLHTAGVYLGVKQGSTIAWQTVDVEVTSGTEQYYTINYKNCPTKVENGKTYYQVVLRVGCLCTDANAGKHTGMISFSSLKYKGLTIMQNYGEASTVRFNEQGMMERKRGNDWVTVTPVPSAEGQQVGIMRMDLVAEQMRSTQVVTLTAKLPYDIWEADEPSETQPDETQPDETQPDETQPDETQPDETQPDETQPTQPIVKDGIVSENGVMYYYVDNQLQYCAGLIQLDGSYYYIRSNGQCAVGQYWVTNTNGLMAQGFYTFGADGKMVSPSVSEKNGIVSEYGALYYYANNNIQYGAGLIQLNGDYYYVRSNGQCATGPYWVTTTNALLPAGFYTFGTDGKLILSSASAKNGIVAENGGYYYYVDGELQYCAGLVQLDGSYYYIRSNGQCATGKYWVTTTNGLMSAGFYTFGTDGKMADNSIEGGN